MPSEIEGLHNLVPAEGNLLILIDIEFLLEENAHYCKAKTRYIFITRTVSVYKLLGGTQLFF